MPRFDIDPEPINAFPIDDHYYVKHYFEREDLFALLQPHYNQEEYRFEIPASEFEPLRSRLREEYIELVPVEDVEPYCVVKEQYTPHAAILRNAVAHWERRGHNFFLLKDELSVREAIEHGATPVSETEFAAGV